MIVAFGSDHAGFELKEALKEFVAASGYEVLDLGAFDAEPSDYPLYSEKVARAILSGEADRGILVCGSGIGASVAANKFPGIYAGNCTEPYSARQGVQHDMMNILVIGARVVGIEVAKEMVNAYLGAKFDGIDRHLRRVHQIQEIEERNFASDSPTTHG